MANKKPLQCVNVISTSQTSENLSRYALLEWINSTSPIKVKNVESLCSGYIYCYYMDHLFPGCVSLKKIKQNGTQEHEHIQNLKQLQAAFHKVGCDKNVPIGRLAKGRFQDNFEFLQWFKKFFDANYAVPLNNSLQSKGLSDGDLTLAEMNEIPICEANENLVGSKSCSESDVSGVSSLKLTAKVLPYTPNNHGMRMKSSGSKHSPMDSSPRTVVKTSKKDFREHEATEKKLELSKLKAELHNFNDIKEQYECERDFFFHKLQEIEKLCEATSGTSKTHYPEVLAWDAKTFRQEVLNVLYSEEQEYSALGEEEP